MFCYCGGCPQDIPRKETVEFLCRRCANLKEGWADIDIAFGRCDRCNELTFCQVQPVKKDWEKEYM